MILACTVFACDRQTDRQTELRWLRRAIAVPAVARKNQERQKVAIFLQTAANFRHRGWSWVVKIPILPLNSLAQLGDFSPKFLFLDENFPTRRKFFSD